MVPSKLGRYKSNQQLQHDCDGKSDLGSHDYESEILSSETPTNELIESHPSPTNEIQARIDAAISQRSGRGNPNDMMLHSSPANHTGQILSLQDPDIPPGSNYEYLDHTADIQLHAWGKTLGSALVQLVLSMFGYMTSLGMVEVDEEISMRVARGIVGQGHDLYSCVYSFLDEWLFLFHDTGFIAKEVEIIELDREQ